MEAIETEYNGILFRSRLEARWAILFDALKLKWVYEPECFILTNNQKYTPDFYLEKYNLYVEIKPNFEWRKNKYHYGRYELFTKQLLVLTGSFPNFNISSLFPDDMAGVVFCPNSKYEPFFYAMGEEGTNESLFEKDYLEELSIVKQHRFYK